MGSVPAAVHTEVEEIAIGIVPVVEAVIHHLVDDLINTPRRIMILVTNILQVNLSH